MSEIPTPRTDAARASIAADGSISGALDDMAELERELAQARELANRETLNAAYWKSKAEQARYETAMKCAEMSCPHCRGEKNWRNGPCQALPIRAYAESVKP